MDIGRYKELKKKKLITMQKVGPAIIVVKRKWDPESGKEQDPEVLNPNPEELSKRLTELIEQKDTLTQNIEAMQDFLKDIQELKKADLKVSEKGPAEGQ